MKKETLSKLNVNNILGNFYNTPCALLPSHHEVLTLKLKAFALNPFTSLADSEDDDDPEGDDLDNMDENPLIEVVGSTAIISIEGNLVNQCSDVEAFLFDAFSLDNFRQSLIQVANADSVKSIVLNFSSGGGSVIGIQETADLINEIEKGKDVYAYTNSYCCSAAYYLASQAQGLFASQSAIVGAIGVYSVFLDTSKMFESEGVEVNLFKAGDYKGMGTPGLPLSKEQKAVMQSRVDDLYAQFVSYVKAKRPKVGNDSMQGLTYDTKQAINLGLVDGQVNNLNALVDYINK